MAQHQLEQRCKHRQVIPISSTRRKTTMMANNEAHHSPRRTGTVPKVDQKDRQQPQQSDTASIASTVKISNVATPSPVPKHVPMDDHRSTMPSVHQSNIKLIIDSRDDIHSSGSNVNVYKRTGSGYQHDSLLASTATMTELDDAPIVCKGKSIGFEHIAFRILINIVPFFSPFQY
jgi:hypothetical protein